MDFVFFFQAEDGIRDGTVTGVQTCALPIYRVTSATAASAATVRPVAASVAVMIVRAVGSVAAMTARPVALVAVMIRSEERRVGKECRARWEPGQGTEESRMYGRATAVSETE